MRLIALALALVAVPLTSCGGGNSSAAASESTTTAPPASPAASSAPLAGTKITSSQLQATLQNLPAGSIVVKSKRGFTAYHVQNETPVVIASPFSHPETRQIEPVTPPPSVSPPCSRHSISVLMTNVTAAASKIAHLPDGSLLVKADDSVGVVKNSADHKLVVSTALGHVDVRAIDPVHAPPVPPC